MTVTTKTPTLAIYKFASCDGCQLSLLDLEDELLTVAGAVDIAHFPEATTSHADGPYDVVLVEGSITTAHDADRIQRIRAEAGILVSIGACATAGGIQALRNMADVGEFIRLVYASPEYISTLRTSTPISDHVAVDFELRGCPIDKHQLLELVSAVLAGRKPVIPTYSVCLECKARGTSCVMVAQQIPCLGPVTQAGCGAICPAYDRGCYGCFGPAETTNTEALARWWGRLGASKGQVARALRTFNTHAPQFDAAARRIEPTEPGGSRAQD
jgi:coenzyme F420-reducing hydrogenase gamma subunit